MRLFLMTGILENMSRVFRLYLVLEQLAVFNLNFTIR